MSSAPPREEFELAVLNENRNVVEGPLAFEYEFPFIDKSTKGRTTTQEPIGRPPVVQHLGPELREITIQGHCYWNEADLIDVAADSGFVDVVSDRWTGIGVVKSAQTSATGDGGGARSGTQNRIYDYTLTVVEVGEELPPGGIS